MKINRKLLVYGKRFLALMLAVTMVTGTLPSSLVYAAEIPTADTEDVSNVLSDDVIADDVSAENVEAVVEDEDAVVDVTEADSTVGEAEVYEDGETTLIKYTFDTTVFNEDYKAKATLPYGDVYITYWANWVKNGVNVFKDGTDMGTLDDVSWNGTVSWTSKWQMQGTDASWSDLDSAPNRTSKVGKYKMIVEIPAVDGVSAAATPLEIPFEITKAEVAPTVTINPVTPGTQANSVKAASASVDTYNDYFVYSDNADNSDLTLNLKVKDAYTGAEVSGELLKTGDYVVEITPAFTDKVAQEKKDCYTLKSVSQKLQMDGLIDPDVAVTMADKWNDGYSVVYTGVEIAAPAVTTDYTVKVQYIDGLNEDYSVKYKEITVGADELTYEWHDSTYYRNKLDSAPVNAGTYYYRITYSGKAGLYNSAYYDIPVEITAKELILVPQWKSATAPEFYVGMSASDVLPYVTYVAKDTTGAEVTIDRDHIWGDFTSKTVTIPYEPEFSLQVESGTNADNTKSYTNTSSISDKDKTYRVIFSGRKYVYYANGDQYYYNYGINDSAGNSDRNYIVKIDNETLGNNVLTLTVHEASLATIDVSNIKLEGTQAAEAGKTYENPYVKVYDGKALYDSRAGYNLAEVRGTDGSSLASGVDRKITYQWYRYSGTWASVGSYNYIPYNAGDYKLRVSYTDPAKQNYAIPVEVFYRIEPQKIKVVPTAAPHALTETAVSKYDFSKVEYEIKTVPAEGEGKVLNWVENKDFSLSWKIQKKADSDTGYSDFNYGNFTEGTSYRVAVKYFSYSSNYIDYEVVTEGTGDDAHEVQKSLNETYDITLDIMGTTELKIEVDGTKLVDKVYDGTAYAIPEGAVKITKADGSAVSDVTPEYRWYSDEDYGYLKDGELPIDGGHYELYVGFSGDTTYKAVVEQRVGEFNITPKELKVEAGVDAEVKAGTKISEAAIPLVFEGVVDRDKAAFAFTDYVMDWYRDENYYRYDAVDYFAVYAEDENGNEVSMVKGNKTYVAYVYCYLDSPYDRNYTVKTKGVSFKTIRGNSTVEAASYGSISEVAITDTVDAMNHVIKPEQGIDYINNYNLSNYNKAISGNYLAFRIYMPAEYTESNTTRRELWKSAFFKNSIENVEKAGGYILGYTEANTSYSQEYITVAFDASARDKKEFKICWEEGYIETFTVDFSSAVLGANLRKAVEPKSIAFNAPIKKMAVGEIQELDVKLTKKLQNDVICLQYTVNNEKVLHVDEDGKVTALATGKADVIVTPVYENEEGKLVPIERAKSAKVAITVTDVTAPKLQKVTALDGSVTVTYGQVNDGFRREIYIIEGKNVKAAEFETRIASMTNQNWKGLFAVAPVFHSVQWNEKKQAERTITGLDSNADYTVYVRNVSQARTLTDGCKVVVSGKGNVKSFKTTKPQVTDLSVKFDYGEDKPVKYSWNDYLDRYCYEVNLSAKSINVGALGCFKKLHIDTAADTIDELWVELPIKDATQKKTYVAPKLEYQVTEEPYNYAEYVPTTLASINKSGKLKLNKVGTVYVRVVDTTTGVRSDWKELNITAAPDSIVAKKNITFEVGEQRTLTSLVDYKEGKLAVNGYSEVHYQSIAADAALIKAVEESPYFEMYEDWAIVAVKAGGKLDLTLTDQNIGASAKVTLKTKALSPVTGLKASYLVDNSATMSFVYNDNGNADAFKVEVTDGRGRVIKSELYWLYSFSNKDYEYKLGYDMSRYTTSNYYYTDAKKKNNYFLTIFGLSKLSSYNVTVTAVCLSRYENGAPICESSKPVKKSIKTTKMPAYYDYLQYDDNNSGISIYYRGLNDDNYRNIRNTYLSSGNTYEVYVSDLQSYAKNMLTDTLTWTSSDSKVATIKANTGSYTATLKALKPGKTVIEVKSKLTKKVIGRYTVYVNAVGTAKYYFNENERQDLSNHPKNSMFAKVYSSKAVTAVSLDKKKWAFGDFAATLNVSAE